MPFCEYASWMGVWRKSLHSAPTPEKNHLVLLTTLRCLCRHRLQRTSRRADPLIFVCQRCSAHEASSISVRAAALAARISWTYRVLAISSNNYDLSAFAY